jgi:octopine/nopaline transport system permease protein
MNIFQLLGFGPQGWGGLLLGAMGMTLAVTLASLALGATIGATLTAAKLSRNFLWRMVADGYTTVFRGVPELLIIYFIYFGGSSLVTTVASYFGITGFLGMPSFLAGVIAVGVISGAYQAEVFRGAYTAVAKGEIDAALAYGMPKWLRFRRIIVPQIWRFALPGLGNVFQLTLKDSALISVTGLVELMRGAQIAGGSTHRYFLFYITGGVLYLVLTSLSGQLFGVAEARVSRSFPRGIGRA